MPWNDLAVLDKTTGAIYFCFDSTLIANNVLGMLPSLHLTKGINL